MVKPASPADSLPPGEPASLNREAILIALVGNAFGTGGIFTAFMAWREGSGAWFVAYLCFSVVIAAVANVAPPLTRRKQRQRDLAWAAQFREMATLDELTRLRNRRYLNDVIDETFRAPAPISGQKVLAVVDLNDFKRINDLHGHAAGDAALVAVSEALRGACQPGDLVARIGGDEFAVLATLPPDLEPDAFAERLRSSVASAQQFEDAPITLSVGVAAFAGHSDGDSLFRAADARMYLEKAKLPNRRERRAS